MDKEIYILDNEQPTCCPLCGLRTDFNETSNFELGDYQQHQYNNTSCNKSFIGVFEHEKF